MKVLLINPHQYGLYGALKAPDHPPLGIGYIASALEREGCHVEIIDIYAERLTQQGLINSIRKGYDLIGLSAVTPSINKAISICKLIKENSYSYTVLGGIHPTVAPHETIQSKYVDFVVRGEGEATIVELIRALSEKRDFGHIDGLVYKRNGDIKFNKDRGLITDLDSIPFPSHHLYKSRKYAYPDAISSNVLPIITSRGCPAGCTYCSTKNIFSRKFRARSPENVVNEIELLINKYGVGEIHIWDDNFTTIKGRVFKIRDEIARRKIRIKFAFPNGIRADFLDKDVLSSLKAMGTYSVSIGVESGSQEMLDRSKKGVKLKQIETTFKLIKEFGLSTWGFFMFGLPGETPDSIQETIDFAVKLNPDIAKFHILQPYPGTEVFEEFKREGLIEDLNFDNYGIHTKPVYSLKNMSSDDLIEWQQRAYRRFYLRPGKILSHLRHLNSWNRLKLNTRTGFSIVMKIFNKNI